MSMEKTLVMKMLDSKKISYEVHDYSKYNFTDGEEIAKVLNEDPNKVFKTLVTVGKSKKNYVFVVPVNRELDLKKAAKACNEKNIELIHQKDLLPLTGYVHGGCSPIGMKKKFLTFIDLSSKNYDSFCVSGGKIGYQIEISPLDLANFVGAKFADLI